MKKREDHLNFTFFLLFLRLAQPATRQLAWRKSQVRCSAAKFWNKFTFARMNKRKSEIQFTTQPPEPNAYY
jgi:hypothetical protein